MRIRRCSRDSSTRFCVFFRPQELDLAQPMQNFRRDNRHTKARSPEFHQYGRQSYRNDYSTRKFVQSPPNGVSAGHKSYRGRSDPSWSSQGPVTVVTRSSGGNIASVTSDVATNSGSSSNSSSGTPSVVISLKDGVVSDRSVPCTPGDGRSCQDSSVPVPAPARGVFLVSPFFFSLASCSKSELNANLLKNVSVPGQPRGLRPLGRIPLGSRLLVPRTPYTLMPVFCPVYSPSEPSK